MTAGQKKDIEAWANEITARIDKQTGALNALLDTCEKLEARVERQHTLIAMLVDTLKELAR
jgi:hypothetical protein